MVPLCPCAEGLCEVQSKPSSSEPEAYWLETQLHTAGKIPFSRAPKEDRNLPDMHLSLYNEVVVFDQATKLAYICVWLHLDKYPSPEHAFLSGKRKVAALVRRLSFVPALNSAKVTQGIHNQT